MCQQFDHFVIVRGSCQTIFLNGLISHDIVQNYNDKCKTFQWFHTSIAASQITDNLMFVQQVVQTNNNENIKALQFFTLCKGFYWCLVDSLHPVPASYRERFSCHGVIIKLKRLWNHMALMGVLWRVSWTFWRNLCDTELTHDSHLWVTGEIWGVYFDHNRETGLCYNKTTLYG